MAIQELRSILLSVQANTERRLERTGAAALDRRRSEKHLVVPWRESETIIA
jgi:hypothetical protein